MMVDYQGCAKVLGLVALVGLLIGLGAVFCGAPWYAVPIAVVVTPMVGAAVAGIVGLIFLADGMGR